MRLLHRGLVMIPKGGAYPCRLLAAWLPVTYVRPNSLQLTDWTSWPGTNASASSMYVYSLIVRSSESLYGICRPSAWTKRWAQKKLARYNKKYWILHQNTSTLAPVTNNYLTSVGALCTKSPNDWRAFCQHSKTFHSLKRFRKNMYKDGGS